MTLERGAGRGTRDAGRGSVARKDVARGARSYHVPGILRDLAGAVVPCARGYLVQIREAKRPLAAPSRR